MPPSTAADIRDQVWENRMGQFGIAQPLARVEDARFLTGQGRYTDDIALAGQAHLVLVRSPHAHAEIAAIDTAAARAAPGVLAVYTIDDLDAAGLADIPCLAPIPGSDGRPPVQPGHPILARGRVRHVGDPLAAVVAETPAAARDAAELVEVDYAILPHVVETARASEPDAPRIWQAAPDNVCLRWRQGEAEPVERAIREAAHVTRLELVENRVVANPMEPRAALAAYDAGSGLHTLYTGSQGAHDLKAWLADHVFGLPRERFRVVTPDVGGGFGSKIFVYAEPVLALFAARELGRPVKWTGERTEAFQSDAQGRDHVATVELAFDAGHRMTALRLRTVANMGAYLSNFAPFIPTESMADMLSGLYRIPAIHAEVTLVFTNTVPVDAYRGAGRPEAAYFVERTVDAAARELGVSPVALRRRNFITAAEMPYTTATGITYDSGDFSRVMETALRHADWDTVAERKAAARRQGRLRGLGFACYVEACAGLESEEARLRLEPDGGATLYVGTQSNGQGHATAYAQLLADALGIEPARVALRQGDTAETARGGGTAGSRSLLMGGGATSAAAEKVIERAKRVAGVLLEVAPGDLEFAEGIFTAAGTDRRIALSEVARAAASEDLPEGLHGALDETASYDAPAMTYPNGCHVCELDVDEDTGAVAIRRYVVVDDFGVVVNPLLARGQVVGGTVQGIGQALQEHTCYEAASGQLVTASFQDYALPRAGDLPAIEVEFLPVPCATNPFGIKGAGEAGAIGAPPAVINALVDALQPRGVHHIDMPATPLAIWRVLHGGHKETTQP